MKYKIFILLMLMLSVACKKRDMTGALKIDFTFSWNGHNYTVADLDAVADSGGTYIFDSIRSGNIVNLSGIQCFVSEISLVDENGNAVVIKNTPHYVNMLIPATLSWTSERFVPAGVYDSIVFYFGLLPEDNVDGRFIDPPESNMFWPPTMGGGYHFMMVDGRWKNGEDRSLDTFNTFGLHVGGGNAKAVRLSFPQRIFMTEDNIIQKNFNMALDKWFNVEPFWDFNVYGGAIMQDTVAQRVLMDRVGKVFSVL
jgi:hypothetical protein